METEKKKKKKKQTLYPTTADTSASAAAASLTPPLDLPTPLTELILERLPLSDYICFAAVFGNWLSIQTHHCLCHSPLPPSMLPLLWFLISLRSNSNVNQQTNSYFCYSPFKHRFYNHLPTIATANQPPTASPPPPASCSSAIPASLWPSSNSLPEPEPISLGYRCNRNYGKNPISWPQCRTEAEESLSRTTTSSTCSG